ncbi:hypothetical protein EI94DRAFT_522241 [Lactarius quietus]|nr:hypothetical protein EI94DRAFT_522241 [Lactarius quietus]
MLQNPTLKAVSFDDLADKYRAIDFQDALADFITHSNNPTASGAALSDLATNTLIPFRSVPVHHRFKFTDLDTSEIVDSVVVRPEQKDARGRPIPCRFDTVLIRNDPASQDVVHRIDGLRVAQVRVVFEIPSRVVEDIFTSAPLEHLAYVEWFSPIPAMPGPNHGLYRVTRLTQNGRRRAKSSREWRTFTVLEQCNSFYINPFSDRESYLMLS